MKNIKMNPLRICALTLLLLSLHPAHAFYNATTGRWLTRDPHDGGNWNLYGFVGNSPMSTWDYLGLDFLWVQPWTYQQLHPLHDPDGPVSGRTDWYYFSPHARPYKSPDCPASRYKVNTSGGAQVVAWWVQGNSDAEAHEAVHIYQHFKPAYEAFRDESEYLGNNCMCKPNADCIAALIEGPMKELYVVQAYAAAAQWDCQEYGWLYPSACRNADGWTLAYLGLLQAFQAALDSCNRIQ